MGDINRIVTVTISRVTTTPTMTSFSGVLIASEFLKASTTPVFGASERVRQYGSLAEIVTAGFATDSFVYRAAAAIFAQSPAVDRVYVGRKLTGADGTEDWDDALAAMILENDDWYGLVVETRTQADQQDVADWVESNKKLCVLASADADSVDSAYNEEAPTCIADYLKANSLERTGAIYHPKAGDVSEEPCPDAAWFGKLFSKAPGSATWAYKTLAGVPVYTLTPTQLINAQDKNCNVYTSIAGVACTQMGQTGTGEYLDIIHGIDWLTARIQNLIFTPIVQQDKIPFTNGGVQIIVTQLKAALQEGVDAKLLASFEVTAPLVVDVSAVKKAARTLPNVKFTAILAGAIHKVEVLGTVTL
jgi:hypothetical protein